MFCFRIAEITTVTPLYMNLTNLLSYTDNVGDTVYYKNVSWNPKSSQKGRHIFCFKAIDDYGYAPSSSFCELLRVVYLAAPGKGGGGVEFLCRKDRGTRCSSYLLDPDQIAKCGFSSS